MTLRICLLNLCVAVSVTSASTVLQYEGAEFTTTRDDGLVGGNANTG